MKKQWDGNRFSTYTNEELSALRLIESMGNQLNHNTDEIPRLEEDYNKKLKEKTDLKGDHLGAWHGIEKPQFAEPGIAGVVDNLVNKYDELVNKQELIITKAFTDFGGVGDGITDNTSAFIEMSKWINNRGGKCKVLFPIGVYVYKPLLYGNAEWREKIELVDVKDVTIDGTGATIKQIKDSSWDSASQHTNQESPIQFRSGGNLTCKNITVKNITLQGDRVPYNATYGDGTCFGLSFRGVENITIDNCNCFGWGTDGIYIGTTYSNTYKSKYAKIINTTCDYNTRQGLSITGCDDVKIMGCSFINTEGGSFGHGIDLEPNGTTNQKNIIISNCYFENNERGAVNVIRTSQVTISGCNITEENCNGAFYCDGFSNDILIHGNNIITSTAVLYIIREQIKNLIFKNNIVRTTKTPNNSATIRINPDGTSTQLNNIEVSSNTFYGVGGVYVKMDGTFIFKNNTMYVSKEDSTLDDVFVISCQCDTIFENNKIEIDSSVIFAEKSIVVSKGIFNNNILKSHSGAILNISDDRVYGVDRAIIGYNEFSPYFYYKGEHTELDVKGKARIVSLQEECTGSANGTLRYVHGGYRRKVSGKYSKVGDIITIPSTSSGNPTGYICTAPGSPGTWVGLNNKI